MPAARSEFKIWLICFGVILAIGAVLAVILPARKKPVAHRRFLVPQSFSGQVYLIHTSGYDGSSTAGSVQTVTVPDNGVAVTAEPMPSGYDDTYFDVTATGGLAQLPVQDLGIIEDTPANRRDPRRLVFNPNAGVLELPGCKVFFESFYVGNRGFLLSDPHSEALESFVQKHPEVCVRK